MATISVTAVRSVVGYLLQTKQRGRGGAENCGWVKCNSSKQVASGDFGRVTWGLHQRPVAPQLHGQPCLALKLQYRFQAFASSGRAEGGESSGEVVKVSFAEYYPALVTGFFFFMWYFLNVIFNILNKKIYNYFPYPYFVSTVHLLVGVVYCLVSWSVGLPKRAPIDNNLFKLLFPVALCHALGHVTSNVSFAAVAVSFTHTIKALEPFFNAAASQFILGQQIPLTLWLSLAPVVIGVSMASLTELSFNWTGFISAMISNISFTYRSIYSKKAMTDMDSTNVYAYISIIALIVCIPPAVIVEGPQLLQHGFKDAIAKVGMTKFISDLFWVGMFYHLYNQVATNTLERVAPLTHAVGNVLKRVFVIGFSIVVFGVVLYSFIKAKMEEEKRASPPCLTWPTYKFYIIDAFTSGTCVHIPSGKSGLLVLLSALSNLFILCSNQCCK